MGMWRAAFDKFLAIMRPSRRRGPRVDTLVLGIGNPGAKYSGTRHNVGFRVVDSLTHQLRDLSWRRHSGAEVATGVLQSGVHLACAKPQTFVNRSGQCAAALLGYYGIQASACLVVVDDFHLRLGTLRFRRQGSDGGHNGLKSIIEAIGPEFPRLRVGIGPLPSGMSPVDFVLGEFGPGETEQREEAIRKAVQAIAHYGNSGIEAAMSTYNT